MTDAEINRIAEYYAQDPRWRNGDGDARGVAERMQSWVGERPVSCLTTAVFMGVALGWLLKRR
jgi:ElaB/YqjD/DUF883 family membrane-anchored ribosome-binding protein